MKGNTTEMHMHFALLTQTQLSTEISAKLPTPGAIKHLEPHIFSSRYPVLSLPLTHTSSQVPF